MKRFSSLSFSVLLSLAALAACSSLKSGFSASADSLSGTESFGPSGAGPASAADAATTGADTRPAVETRPAVDTRPAVEPTPSADGDARPAAAEPAAPAEALEPSHARRPRSGAGQLTAREWRDLDDWDEWLRRLEGDDPQRRSASPAARWRLHSEHYFPVVVETAHGPAADVAVVLYDERERRIFEARTDSRGRAYLFAGLTGPRGRSYRVVARADGVSVGVTPLPGELTELRLPEASEPERVADVMFVVDTTGSMGDELKYLQVELADVIRRVQRSTGNEVEMRLSVNFYRDQGDAYVLRSHRFTSRLSTVLSQLARQAADGGGDFPEAVEKALEDGVSEHRWSDSARARLLFLVLDAPPRFSPHRVEQIRESVRLAAKQGIRIIPVAASGIDKETEFLMRHFGVATGGTYVFLTDDSGIGNAHLEASVGHSPVERLNDLLARLIVDAIRPVESARGQLQARR